VTPPFYQRIFPPPTRTNPKEVIHLFFLVKVVFLSKFSFKKKKKNKTCKHIRSELCIPACKSQEKAGKKSQAVNASSSTVYDVSPFYFFFFLEQEKSSRGI
jgi:hypothetical protein